MQGVRFLVFAASCAAVHASTIPPLSDASPTSGVTSFQGPIAHSEPSTSVGRALRYYSGIGYGSGSGGGGDFHKHSPHGHHPHHPHSPHGHAPHTHNPHTHNPHTHHPHTPFQLNGIGTAQTDGLGSYGLFTVSLNGATRVDVVLWGAGGGNGCSNTGGKVGGTGGYMSATLDFSDSPATLRGRRRP